MLLILNKTPLIWRWLQVLEQERHQLRLRLEEVEEEQQQRLLELAADAAALRWVGIRLQRWSFFYNDGMVMFFFQGTIAINGFSMVLPSLDHHH